MSRLRLFLVTDAVGGVWTYSLELARALRPFGVDAVLGVMGPPPSTEQRMAATGVELIETGQPLEWLDSSPAAVRRAGEVLARFADDWAADIVQTSSAALLAHADFKQPCVAVQHSCVASWWAAVRGTTLPPAFEWQRDLVERGIHRASAVVAPSIAFAAETSRIYDAHTLAVHNGRTRAPALDLPQGDFVFTSGRLWDEGKNVMTLDAAAALAGAPFQAAGPVAGPNGASVDLRHIDALGELGSVRLAALNAARPVYASAALYEPFGLSVLEAAQAGCALVLSDIPTHREIWAGAAIFVPAHDCAAFAVAIGDLFADSDEREQLGQLARARAAHYTPERMARGMAELYARIAPALAAPEPLQVAGAA